MFKLKVFLVFFLPLALQAQDVLKVSRQAQMVYSKYDHCLYDILGRYNSGELFLEIPFILSNHMDLKSIADSFKIPFYHIPVTKDIKAEAEAAQLKLLNKHKIEFSIL